MKQGIGIVVAGGGTGDADADGQADCDGSDHNRLPKSRSDPVHHAGPAGDGVNALDENDELIASDPGDGVLGPAYLFEPGGNRLQDGIAYRMAEGVIDALEMIDVAEKNADGVSGPRRPAGGGREPVNEQGAIGQSGERVVQGPPAKPFDFPALERGIAPGRHDKGDLSMLVDDGTGQPLNDQLVP